MTIRNHKLRAGIVLSTAIAAPLTVVEAQTQDDENYTVISTEGGMTKSNSVDKIGNSIYSDYSEGFYGSVEILRSVNNGWDWSLSATSQDFGEVNAFDDEYGDSLNYSSSNKIVDFNLGKNFREKNLDVRLSAGVTALQLSQHAAVKGLTEDDDDIFVDNATVEVKYQGFGARVGVDAKLQMGENSPISIFGGVSAALTHGSQNAVTGVDFIYDEVAKGVGQFSLTQRNSRSDNVRHVSANIGLEVEAGNNTTFRIGVRHDEFTSTSGIPINNGNSVDGTTGYVGVAIRF
ncbi:Lpg1974 family pore-forming outer membrane protein [Amylibacter sp.]|nr:Lpg1974 family pore-forming outer membrane protein [Amylibacter sp.]